MISDMYVDAAGACGTVRRLVFRLDGEQTVSALLSVQASRGDVAKALRGMADAIDQTGPWHESA